jgi:hypothetical protein
MEVKDCDTKISCILVAVTDIKGQPRQLISIKDFDVTVKFVELEDSRQFL